MPALRICLLGGFELRYGDETLPPPATLKACSLLAYLVVHRDRTTPREQLADLFWPDRPRDKALHSLSTALWHIRRVLLRNDYILADTRTAQFDPASDYWLDVEEFRASCSSVSGSASLKPETLKPETVRREAERLERAVDLYRGDFLEGFYDDWCLEERYRLEGLYLEALGRLVAAHEALDQPEEALRCTGLLLARDPLREDVYRSAIRLHVRLGDRAEAVRQAQWCRAALRTELGVEPAPETVALCDELLGPAWRVGMGEETPVKHEPPPRSLPALILEHSPFVGREAEWEWLLADWERARSGQGHLVLIAGEAGIGKTRLVEELGRYVWQQGGWVACGHCYEYESALPYGLPADLLRASLTITGVPVWERLPPWQVAELVRLAPELSERLASPPRRFSPAGQQQARLFDALTFFLLDLARQNPLLLVLEDLHWAHDSTLAWVHYLVRRLPRAPVLLVATYRRGEVGPHHPLYGLAVQLEQEGLATRLELGRLPRQALACWMIGASDALVMCVHRQTDGNPFFTLETLRILSERELVQFVEGRWVEKSVPDALPVPTSVRQVIQMRLDRLSPLAGEAVATAAVIGRAFDFDVLELAWDQGEEAALEAMDELLRRRLVREGSGPAGRDYEFDHHLVQEVIYQGLHHRRRQRLHRLVGHAMEQLRAGQPHVASQLAHHFERAGQMATALNYMVTAGEEALALCAFHEALDLFARALGLIPVHRDDSLRARALTGWATARREIGGDDPDVWQRLEQALGIWQQLGESARLAGVCYLLAYRHADFEQARAMVRRGLEAVREMPGLEELTSRGYGLLARFYEHEGDFAQARVWAERQRELSEHISDRRGLAHAHHRLGSLLLRIGGPMSQAEAHEREAARLAEELGWRDFAAGSHNIAGYCLLTLGHTAEAKAECELALRLSTELDIPWRQCWACHYLAKIASLQGEWEEAAALLDRAEATMVHQSTHFQELALLRARGQLAARWGDRTAARPILETALEVSQRFYPRYVPELELELAALSLDEGEESTAREWLERARKHAERKGIPYVLAIAGRLQGQLAARAGDWPTAEVAFTSSVHRCQELEQVVEIARTRLVWGRALLAHDAARARMLLEAALAAFEAAQARPEAMEARRLLE